MSNPRDRCISVLDELKRQRSRLDETIRSMERWLEAAYPESITLASNSNGEDNRFPTTVEAVKCLLSENGAPLSPKELFDLLCEDTRFRTPSSSKDLGSLLSRHANRDDSDIVSWGYGAWGLRQWEKSHGRIREARDAENPCTPPRPGLRAVRVRPN